MQNIGDLATQFIRDRREQRDWSGNSDLIRRVVTDLTTKLNARDETTFHAFKGRCESPIECVALAGLLVIFPGATLASDAKALKARKDWEIGIIPQMVFRGYRFDFGVFNRALKSIHDLECDGRAYHQNKSKDCARAASLWREGAKSFHVSGSSLCRAPLNALEPFRRLVLGQ